MRSMSTSECGSTSPILTLDPTTCIGRLSILALTSKRPRIITTNYDRHLSTCLRDRADENGGGSCEPEVREYLSLEFPLRDDFTGLVYLHGSVSEPASNLVVTAADFGRVYLTARWTAAQFLSAIFHSSTVLFIGYSHEDTLMKYLSLGLTAEEDHSVYALCKRKGVAGALEGTRHHSNRIRPAL